jgi:hypothetical protein
MKRKLILNPKNPARNRRLLAAAAKMPPLDHWPDSEPPVFDIMKSEVAKWLVDQPQIRQWVFDWFRRTRAIEFVESGVWQGVLYGQDL